MPYLQIDVSEPYPLAQKQLLAKRLGEIYAAKNAGEREEGIGCHSRARGRRRFGVVARGEPYQAALLMCDIRRGRPAEQRAEFGKGPC